jgi:hypothetical protein
LLAWLIVQVPSYRRSADQRRQQLKWLYGGGAVFLVSVLLGIFIVPLALGDAAGYGPPVVNDLLDLGAAALPVCIGVAVLKYRLYAIDRIISRVISYAIITAVLAGVFTGLVILATDVLPVKTPVAVAASTLVAAALFNPLRRRVQRAVDRRFNRARYNAEAVVAAFTMRLRQTVDLDTVQDDLTATIQQAFQPPHISVWLPPGISVEPIRRGTAPGTLVASISPGHGQLSEVKRRAWDSNPRGRVNALMVFKSIRGSCAIAAPAWLFQYSGVVRQARSSRVYPALGLATVPSTRRPSGGKPTRTLQGMARVRSGQAPAWPLSSGRSARRDSRVKRDFACTLAGAFPPVLVVLREQSRLGLEGRTRTLSGPSPDLTSSVSGLLRDSADVRQARSRCVRCCPGVTLRAPVDHLIRHAAGTTFFRSSGQVVQDRPVVSAYWAEIPGPSSRVRSWLRPWQQCWLQSSTCLQSDVFVCCDSADLARQLSVSSREIPLTSGNGT